MTDVAADDVATIGGLTYLSNGEALCMPLPPDTDAGDGAAAEQRCVNLTAMLRPYSRSPARVEGLTAGCTATALDINVGLDVCNISGGNARPDTSLHIQGALLSPATAALRTRPAQAWLLSIAGTVSADFVFDSITADFDDGKDTR